MFSFERAVRFQDVDAAGIVFFGTFLTYAHEAMEQFFAGVDGSYHGLITKRRVGLPAVDVQMSFSSPLRYGDTLRIEVRVRHLGNKSAKLEYQMVRVGDDKPAATVLHTVVTTDLDKMASCDMPPDVRRVLQSHLEAA